MAKLLFLCSLFPLLLNAEDVAHVLSLPKMPEPVLGPDAMVKKGVPQGKVTEHVWKESKVYPGTIRKYSVYQPAQYDAGKPTAVMVFQDGHSYLNPKGDCRATVVLDNLIASKEIPPIIGIFINPGLIRKTPKKPIRAFFQDGIHDLDNEHGSWPLGNMQMQAALKFAGYDHRYVWGHGGMALT